MGMRHYIAATLAALVIITPVFRGFFGFSEKLYIFFAIMLFIFAALSKQNWSVNSWQLSWWFCLVFLFTYLLAASSPFSNHRAVLIAGGFLISSIGVGILGSLYWSEKFFQVFVYMLTATSLVLSAIVIFGYLKGRGDFRIFLSENSVGYLTLGSFISLGFCMSLPLVLTRTGKKKLIWFLFLMGNGAGLITVLSRGALLFSGIVAVLVLIYYWPNEKTIKRVLFSFTIRLTAVAFAVYLVIDFMPARTLSRLNRLFFGDELQSGGRGELWNEALHKIAEAPMLGHGLGESSVVNIYPHNLFLQVGIDGGLLAIILLMVVVTVPLIIFYKAMVRRISKYDPLPISFLAAYLWSLFEYFKSGDFYKARAFFIIASLLVGYLSILYKKTLMSG